MQAFWIGETIPTSNQNSQTSKEIEVDISTYLGYPVKALDDFLPVSIFNLQFFVRVFSMT